MRVILSSICFTCGRYEPGNNKNEEGETDSNFAQLLKMCAKDISSLFNWIKKSQAKFTSPDIQNEIVSLLLTEDPLCANIQDKEGNTALHLACHKAHKRSVNTLLVRKLEVLTNLA